MKKKITQLILGFCLAVTGYSQSYQLPIEVEITEDAINLFLLKQFNDLSASTKTATYNYQGVTYTAELNPLSIDLRNNIVDTYINFQVSVSWENLSTEVDYSYFVSFDFSGTDELSANLIIGNIRNGIQNNGLPGPVKTFILNAFDNLNLQAYPDAIVEQLNNDPIVEQNPLDFTSFTDVFAISNDVLAITVTFDLLAQEPMMELMLTSSGDIRCRLNFKAFFGEIILGKGCCQKYSTTFCSYALESECTYNPSQQGWDYGIIIAENDYHAYKAYFNLSGAPSGVWISPEKFY